MNNVVSGRLFRILGISVIILALLIAALPLGIEAEGEQYKLDGEGKVESVIVSPESGKVLDITSGSAFADGFTMPDEAAFTEIKIPKTMQLTDVFDEAHNHTAIKLFELVSVTKFSVDGENPEYSSDDQGIIYDKNKTTLLKVPAGYTGTIRVPDSVTKISAYAFYGTHAREITIPQSVGTLAANTIKDGKSDSALSILINIPKTDTVMTQDCIVSENAGNTITIKAEAGSTIEKYVSNYNSTEEGTPGKKPDSAQGTLKFESSTPTVALTLNDTRSDKTGSEKIKLEASKAGNYTLNVADSQGEKLKSLLTLTTGAVAVYYDLSLVDTADTTKAITDFGTAKVTLPISSDWNIGSGDNVKAYSIDANNNLEILSTTATTAEDGTKTVTFTTTHFSEFAVVYSPVQGEGNDPTNPTEPNNPTNPMDNQGQTTPGNNSSAGNVPSGGTGNTSANTGVAKTAVNNGRVDMPVTGDGLSAKGIVVILMILTGLIFIAISIPVGRKRPVN